MKVDDAINLDDLRKIAKQRLPKVIYDFIEGGVDDEEGLNKNEDAFSRRPLLPRYLVAAHLRSGALDVIAGPRGNPEIAYYLLWLKSAMRNPRTARAKALLLHPPGDGEAL